MTELDRLNQHIQGLRRQIDPLVTQLGRVIVGQQVLIDRLLLGLLTGGHLLLEGVPGVAKTLVVKTLSRILGLEFQRVQCTSDLMPADIVGTNIGHR